MKLKVVFIKFCKYYNLYRLTMIIETLVFADPKYWDKSRLKKKNKLSDGSCLSLIDLKF